MARSPKLNIYRRRVLDSVLPDPPRIVSAEFVPRSPEVEVTIDADIFNTWMRTRHPMSGNIHSLQEEIRNVRFIIGERREQVRDAQLFHAFRPEIIQDAVEAHADAMNLLWYLQRFRVFLGQMLLRDTRDMGPGMIPTIGDFWIELV